MTQLFGGICDRCLKPFRAARFPTGEVGPGHAESGDA
ncbi:hypothetical protein MAV_0838 [Mycobacterium avium 104]|uniref:Uncharacterized protein n=1 Tax=Mycobacterium avium (strain 104) TaxID=243243 RepID=A0A0H2ZXW3_MYCA1|nr:hypothetical protein MAV_0838 [Mycobacterium avium 104]